MAVASLLQLYCRRELWYDRGNLSHTNYSNCRRGLSMFVHVGGSAAIWRSGIERKKNTCSVDCNRRPLCAGETVLNHLIPEEGSPLQVSQ